MRPNGDGADGSNVYDGMTSRSSNPSCARTVLAILQSARTVAMTSAAQAGIAERIATLEERIAASILRVAVVGQLKRGKSSLLNALLGEAILPSGLTPVTSIPTFISYGRGTSVKITFANGRTAVTAHGRDRVAEVLKSHVSESENPENALGIAHIKVTSAAPVLAAGIELVDTPGIGSTFLHNTRTAQESLPECDVGLFVFSIEPPVTETEAAYVERVSALMPKIVFVLNKIDQVSDSEAGEAAAFLRQTLERLPFFCRDNVHVVPVSAKAALAARADGDRSALELSGVPGLERTLEREVVANKHALLGEVVLRRATALVAELSFQMELERNAIAMPSEKLREKAAFFDAAANRFESDRRRLADRLTVERRVALRLLDERIAAAWQKVRQDLDVAFADIARMVWEPAAARAKLTTRMQEHFSLVYESLGNETRQAIEAQLRSQSDSADELVARVRHAAAELMDIPLRAISPENANRDRREPFWSPPQPAASLQDATGSALARLLPAPLRRRLEVDRFRKEAERAALKNLSNLDFATRQDIEDAFRRAEADLDGALSAAVSATRDALRLAQETRTGHAATIAERLRRADASLADLRLASDALEAEARR